MRIYPNKCSIRVLTGAAVIMFVQLAHADVLWTLEDVTFSNGETASGTMVVGTTLDSGGFYLVESWDITLGGLPSGYLTTLSGTANVNTYVCSTPADAACLVETGYYLTTPVQGSLLFSADTTAFGSGTGLATNVALEFQESFFPPTAGVTIPLLVSTPSTAESYISAYNFNTGQYDDVGNLVTGSIIESAGATTVPEPSSIAPCLVLAIGVIIPKSRGRAKGTNAKAQIV